jgi:hypothetical protein
VTSGAEGRGEELVLFGRCRRIGTRRRRASHTNHNPSMQIDSRPYRTDGPRVVGTLNDGLGRRDHVDQCDGDGRTRAIGLDRMDGASLESHGPRHQWVGEIQREVHQE